MLVYIYKSLKKDEMYLYLKSKDDFAAIPEALASIFGPPQFSMVFDISKREKLARVDIDIVKKSLEEEGYFLQLPPKPENLLNNKLIED